MLAKDNHLQLLQIAKRAIDYGLSHHGPIPIEAVDFPLVLQEQRATFVSLHRKKVLRGCIGTLLARQPLICDVAHNAYAAAFQDPRFLPMKNEDIEDLQIQISILEPPQPLPCASEEDLLAQLRPKVDGLILETAGHHATFLPAVWDSLPAPSEFLYHLKQKAGLPADYWSEDLCFQRYLVVAFEGLYADL